MYNVELSEIEICRLASLAREEAFSAQSNLKNAKNDLEKELLIQTIAVYMNLFNKLYNVVSR